MSIALMPVDPYDRRATDNSKICTAVLEMRQKPDFAYRCTLKCPKTCTAVMRSRDFPGRTRAIRFRMNRVTPKQTAAPFADNHLIFEK